MRRYFKTFIVLITIGVSLFGKGITYETRYMNNASSRMSHETIQQIVSDALNPEGAPVTYYKADVNVYTNAAGIEDYFVVYLARSDIYLVDCYRLELEGSEVVSVIEDYVEEENTPDVCYTCPDPEVQALFSTSITEVTTAKEAIEYAAFISERVGLKTKTLLMGEQTSTNVGNYLSCPKMRIWGFVGHGNSNLIQVSGGQSITTTFFQALPNGLNDMTLVLNACDVHMAPFEQGVYSAGAYFFGGGDGKIESMYSENVMKAFIRKVLDERMEMMQAGEEAEEDMQYFLYGWSGDGSGPPYIFKGPVGLYLNITMPKGGEEWDLGTFHVTTWESNVDGNVKIDLCKGSSVVKTLVASTENTGSASIKIDDDLTPGNDYKIQISSIEQDTLVNESNNFSVTGGEVVTQFPYNMNCDEVLGLPEGWAQAKDDDIDWILISGATPSRKGIDCDPDKTGPEGDHTTGSDYYFYVEASGSNSPQKEATLITPKFNVTNLSSPGLSFWVHMFSANKEMGDLYIDICVGGTWTNDVVYIQGDQGDGWFEVRQNLKDFSGERVGFRIRGVTGSSWCSDIAIDDFKVGEAPTAITVHPKPVTVYDLQFLNAGIRYQIPESRNDNLSINLYSTQGQLVRTLVNGPVQTGTYTIVLQDDSNNLAAGTYVCHMKTGKFNTSITIVIQK